MWKGLCSLQASLFQRNLLSYHCKVIKETGKSANLVTATPNAVMKCYFWLLLLCGYTYFNLLRFIALLRLLFLSGICHRFCCILNHSYAIWNTIGLKNSLVRINRASLTLGDLTQCVEHGDRLGQAEIILCFSYVRYNFSHGLNWYFLRKCRMYF